MSSTGISSKAAFIPSRKIGTMVADCTIEEDGNDEVTITDLPVQQGAAITDHAFVNPPSLVILAKWSNASPQAGGDPNYCTTQYTNLLKMKDDRIPFDILTPQRKYTNMLIKSVAKHTDERTENALECTIMCRNVILVDTQTTTVPPNSSQKTPQKTGSITNSGTKQTVPAPNYNAGP